MNEPQKPKESLFNVWRLANGEWSELAKATPARNRHDVVERFNGAVGMPLFGRIKVRKVLV